MFTSSHVDKYLNLIKEAMVKVQPAYPYHLRESGMEIPFGRKLAVTDGVIITDIDDTLDNSAGRGMFGREFFFQSVG